MEVVILDVLNVANNPVFLEVMNVSGFGGCDLGGYERRLKPRLTFITSKILEVMSFGGCELGGYERSLYPCFLEVMNVGCYGFGGYDPWRLWPWTI